MNEIDNESGVVATQAAAAALEVLPFAMVIADASGRSVAVNQRWTDLSGLDRADSLGAGWLSVLDPEGRSRLRDDIHSVAGRGGELTADYPVTDGPGRRWTRWWLTRCVFDGTALVVVAAADVHEDYTRLEDLYHLATHDSLTGLLNKSHFAECVDHALRRNQRVSRRVGVIYVDLDGFKAVNDVGGHAVGDRLLLNIAARLRHAVRGSDLVARVGGDEFAVLCEGLSDPAQIQVVADRISQTLSESVQLEGRQWKVLASVGAAVDTGGDDTPDDLLDRADRAMYTVKMARRSGGGATGAVIDLTTPAGPPNAPAPAAAERAAVAAGPVTAGYAGPVDQPPERRIDLTAGDTNSRLAQDVVTLRSSLASIHRMLDRLTGEKTSSGPGEDDGPEATA